MLKRRNCRQKLISSYVYDMHVDLCSISQVIPNSSLESVSEFIFEIQRKLHCRMYGKPHGTLDDQGSRNRGGGGEGGTDPQHLERGRE